jgi:hypothetical protein
MSRKSGNRFSEKDMRQQRDLEHDPEKHALGLDPMGGYRFSEKDHAPPKTQSEMPVQLQMIALCAF